MPWVASHRQRASSEFIAWRLVPAPARSRHWTVAIDFLRAALRELVGGPLHPSPLIKDPPAGRLDLRLRTDMALSSAVLLAKESGS